MTDVATDLREQLQRAHALLRMTQDDLALAHQQLAEHKRNEHELRAQLGREIQGRERDQAELQAQAEVARKDVMQVALKAIADQLAFYHDGHWAGPNHQYPIAAPKSDTWTNPPDVTIRVPTSESTSESVKLTFDFQDPDTYE